MRMLYELVISFKAMLSMQKKIWLTGILTQTELDVEMLVLQINLSRLFRRLLLKL